MKVRTTFAGTALRARLTALCWGALTLLAPVAVSACSGSSTSPTIPTFTPSVTIPGTATGFGTAPASTHATVSGTPGVISAPKPTVTVTVTETATPTVTETATPTVTETVTAPAISSSSEVPTAAPVTGGGGTAGLQDGLLFGLGAAALLAGAGSIVYRRRLTRHR
jgi:carbohydrate-binding DOMON domain-containing protein